MPLFEVPKLNSREQDLALLKKSKTRVKTTTTTKSSGGSLVNKINAIKAMVETHLGKYKDETLIIQDIDTLHDYIDKCIANGICGIDTETTGLDPLQDDLVGVGIYTPNEKTTYIPINHISYVTGQRVKNQLTEEEVGKELARLNIDIDMFNAPFDIRFIKNHNGPRLKCTWDAYLASRCLNENEPNKGLKKLHQKYVLRGEEDAFKFDELFKGVNFAYVPIQTGALYAAHDPKITYEYAEYQRNIFKTKESLKDVYWVFQNIEMPCIDAIIELEDNGVEFDFDYNQKLKDKYHKILDEKMEDFQTAYHMYDEDIAKYDGKVRFDEPINIASVPQLQALLYDIIGLKGPIDKKTKEPSRSTSEEALKVNKDNAVVKAILEYREFATIVSTFIDKLPECVNPKDGRIHCKFNQYGADCVTGETSLLTSKGYIPIMGLFDGTELNGEFVEDNTEIFNRYLKQESASHRIMFSDAPTIRLTLRGGYQIEGTYNHPVITSKVTKSDIQRNKSDKQIRDLGKSNDFKKLENIKEGDIIAIPYGYNKFPVEYQKLDCILYTPKTHNSEKCIMPEYCDEDFAELLGMYHADGSYKDSNGTFVVTITNKDVEVQDRIKYLVKKLFNEDAWVWKDKWSIGTSFGNVQIADIKKYLVKGARNKCVPEIIMRSPKSVICAYIRGMTLDSSFHADRQRLRISCAGDISYNFIKSALLNIGIISSVKREYYAEGLDHAGNKSPAQTNYRISIVGEMYKKFLDEIGVIQSSKKLILPRYKKHQFLVSNDLLNGKMYYAYVEKIEYSHNTVYDLHIPNTHSFIANGIVNHNTGRMSSQDPNLQNIPSHNKEIRKMFKATSEEYVISTTTDSLEVENFTEVETPNGWKYSNTLKSGDELLITDDNGESVYSVESVNVIGNKVIINLYV